MKILWKVALSFILLFVVVGVSYLKSDLKQHRLDDAMTTAVASDSLTDLTHATPAALPEESTDAGIVTKPTDASGGGDSLTHSQDTLDFRTPEDAQRASQPPTVLAVNRQTTPTQSYSSPKVRVEPIAGGGPETEDTATATERLLRSSSREKGAVNTTAADARERAIADFYAEKLSKLTDDMTAYERKVALRDIRELVCDKYHIRTADLLVISKKYDIKIPQ